MTHLHCCLCTPRCGYLSIDHEHIYCDDCSNWNELVEKLKTQKQRVAFYQSLDPTAPYVAGHLHREKVILHRLETALAELEGEGGTLMWTSTALPTDSYDMHSLVYRLFSKKK